jgi:addiction module RelB/DinJ family antitoxin
MSNTIQVRVDQKTKRSVTKIFAALGLDLSTGIKIYFQQVLREKGIPFPLVTENGFTPEQEKKLLAEVKKTRQLYAQGKLKTYKTWTEAKKAMLAD